MADPTRLDRDDIATHEAHHAQHTMPTRLDATSVGGGSASGKSPTRGSAADFQPLPDSLVAEGYRAIERLGTASAEANVWSCRAPDGSTVAVKVYFRPPRYDLDESSLQNLEPKWFVKTLSRGVDPRRDEHFEVMEYCSEGSLEQYLRSRCPLGADQPTALTIANQLAAAIAGLQQRDSRGRRLVHGDIKPANILVRSADPLEVVLADFGLLVDLGDRSALSNFGAGSVAYMAPELEHAKGAPSDWWSLGLVLYRVLVGRAYYEGLTDGEIAKRRSQYDVSVAGVGNERLSDMDRERWKILLAGLLTKDVRGRWGGPEVDEWLRGGTPRVHRTIDMDSSGWNETRSVAREPWVWAGVGEFYEAETLGNTMAAQQHEAARMLTAGRAMRLRKWLTAQAQTGDTYPEIADRIDWGPAEQATYFIARLAPDAPLSYRGYTISTPADLRALVTMGDESVIAKLFESELLASLATGPAREAFRMIDATWHDYVQRASEQALARGITATPGMSAHLQRESLRLAAADAHVAAAYVASVRKRVNSDQLSAAREMAWFANLARDAGLS